MGTFRAVENLRQVPDCIGLGLNSGRKVPARCRALDQQNTHRISPVSQAGAPPKIPSPDKGWPGPARVRWFRTFAMNVSQIYDGDGEPVEMKIELEKEAAN
jgi:hypothetical protein